MTEGRKYGIVIASKSEIDREKPKTTEPGDTMRYKSTRNSPAPSDGLQVIAQGISEEGGLFVPEAFPDLSARFPVPFGDGLQGSGQGDLRTLFVRFFPRGDRLLRGSGLYRREIFRGSPCQARPPSQRAGERKFLLELWHGPTCAFKDMALQILPHFLTTALGRAGDGKEAVILTATSGDTGKAALEGFKDVPGTRILVFYPRMGSAPCRSGRWPPKKGLMWPFAPLRGTLTTPRPA